MFGMYYVNDDNSKRWNIEPEVTWRPRQNIQFSGNLSYVDNHSAWAWIGSAEDENGATQYIWSALDQKTIRLTLRTDLTLTPTLSIQYYAQPFFTAGDYYDLMRVDDPYAKDFDKRFEMFGDRISYNEDNSEYEVDRNLDGVAEYTFAGNVDFNYKQFRSNLVLRWEYKTGSSLFLVWSQGFTDYETFQPFEFGRDAGTLFDTDGDNVLMIKISHMLNL